MIPRVAVLSLGLAAAAGISLRGEQLILTNAAAVRALSQSEAARGRPATLQGVVLDQADPREHAVVLADATAAIYMLADTGLFSGYRRGDLLEISGVTDPGQFAPIVRARQVRKLGTAALPSPRTVSYQQLITGALDAQWIELTGVVRRVYDATPGSDVWRFLLAADGGVVPIRTSITRTPELKEDAEVRVRAVCFYQFNQKRQVLTPVLQVPTGIPVQVIRPAPADPFAAPVRSADSLLQFAPDAPTGHRIRVRGVVTHAQPGTVVWIRDHSAGVRVQAGQVEESQPGDEIDVLGFLAYGAHSPILEDAMFRKTGSSQPPSPLRLTNIAAAFDHEDDLIETEAMLTDIQPVLEGLAFTFESGETVFKGILKAAAAKQAAKHWQTGSRVRVAGICQLLHDDVRPLMGVWQPQSFQLLLRSVRDLTVLEAPPWWTPKRITYVLALASSALLLAVGVVTLHGRHRLKEQSRRRAMAEAEFAAILAERNRVAREIHDTLAQGLAATSVHLRLARKMSTADPEGLNHHLDVAQQLVGESLDEARNSIWNMRSQVLETCDLPGALSGILKQMADGTELQTRCAVTGKTRRLSTVVENNVLRIGQEAITNAMRHARARHVRVDLDFAERQLRLTVRDDGQGFDPDHLPSGNGSFGLMGMRERAAELKAALKIHSESGKGTEVVLTVPL